MLEHIVQPTEYVPSLLSPVGEHQDLVQLLPFLHLPLSPLIHFDCHPQGVLCDRLLQRVTSLRCLPFPTNIENF